MFDEYPQDKLTFTLTEEYTLANDTVRVSVPVSAMVKEGETEDRLRARIKEALNSFIKTEWQFGAIYRAEDKSGVENVSLTATTRVNERENHNLTERARKAGTKGLQLGAPVADYTMPNDKVQNARAELRRRILGRAIAERDALNAVAGIGQVYRVHEITYRMDDQSAFSNKGLRAGSTYSTGTVDTPDGGEALTHSSKITMYADVTLAHDFIAERKG